MAYKRNIDRLPIPPKDAKVLPNEPHEPVRLVIIDPRRTVTVNACEDAAGKSNVLHLAIETGTDLILFNALMTEIAAKGWLDRDFIAGFDDMLAANKVGIDEAARVTGLNPEDVRKAVAWIAEPKQGGARRRTMFAYEKGLIWGNDNYRTNGALVSIALATGNVGRPGGGDASAWAAIRRGTSDRPMPLSENRLPMSTSC
jgi:arsenite oxidase large subunit